jgi:Domain of unknown function (DUF1707)
MAGPGDEIAARASDRGRLRASHADREQAIGTLKAAFVQGMLDQDEFGLRVSQTLAARTHADLAALTVDLPTGLAGTRLPGKTGPAQANPAANKALLRGSWVVVLLTIGFMLGAFPASPLFALVVGVLPLLIAVPVAGTLTLDAWREKRSHGRLPPGPARPGPGLEGEQVSPAGDDLIGYEAREDPPARPAHSRRAPRRTRWSLTGRQDQRLPASLQVTA